MWEKKQSLISIIIPVYRVPVEFFQVCLESLEHQTYKNFEVILVFDERSDEYDALIRQFESSLCLNSCFQEHLGVSAARNNGISCAKGEKIVFIDSDDWMEADALQVMNDYMNETGADLVMADYVMDYDKYTQHVHTYCAKDRIIDMKENEEFLRDVLRPQSGAGFVWGKMFKRKLLEDKKLRFCEDLCAGEDAEYLLRVAYECSRIAFKARNLYHYRYNPRSAVRQFHEDYAVRYINSMNKIRMDIKKRRDLAGLRDAYYNCVLYHLLLIVVNYSFHPQKQGGMIEHIQDFKKMVKRPIFSEALRHIIYRNYTFSRKITLFFIRTHCYAAVALIAQIRHLQFLKYRKKGQ